MTAEEAVRQFLGNWGPEVVREAGNFTLSDFAAQCEAMLDAHQSYHRSKPFMPGICMSRIKHVVLRLTDDVRNSSADAKQAAAYPIALSRL
jgi:hypothetical protein